MKLMKRYNRIVNDLQELKSASESVHMIASLQDKIRISRLSKDLGEIRLSLIKKVFELEDVARILELTKCDF